jgi:hypothetical protein
VQKLHRDEGVKRITDGASAPVSASEPSRPAAPQAAPVVGVNSALTAALADLIKAKARLDGLLE